MPEARDRAVPAEHEPLERVLDTVRQLALETGGARAARAVAPDASLDREIGLGSLERVELLARLERDFGRALGDEALALDTARGLSSAIVAASPTEPLRPPPQPRRELGAAHAIGADVRSLCESLRRHAELDPARPHVFLRGEGSAPEVELSYGRLWDEARAVAGGLRERGIGRGDAVALMLPTGVDFLRAFAGILLLRAVPVPIYPPLRLDRLEEYARRQSAILKDAQVALLVTIARARPVARLLTPAVPSLRDVVTADELAESGTPAAGEAAQPGDIAFVQYTSGSTGQPKGVVLTHANLLANIRAIAHGLELAPTDVGVSWLPLYHDMGLIGSWLNCMHHGVPLTLLPPTAFLARPERWLWAIHERRATLSPAPNFAYELCVRRIADTSLEGLDLSSWRVALNGAEPVSPATLERFASRFERYGFRREAMTPVYGLAECSVALAFPPLGRGPRVDHVAREPFSRDGRAEPAPADAPGSLEFVSAGRALPEHEIRIVDDAGAEVAERVVGRLIFRGPSATSGYLGNPEATSAITMADGFLDSGDLAYRADGEIYVCGRRKDLIIKAGRNLVPQEIEEAAAEVPGVRRGCVVAFGAPNPALGTEALVVVAETRASDPGERDRIVAAVTERVAAALELPPDQVILVAPGAVPKTSSGKLRRDATRQLFTSGALGQAPGTSGIQKLRLLHAAAAELARPVRTFLGRALYAAWLAVTLVPLLLAVWLLVLIVPSRRFGFGLARLGSRAGLRLLGCRLSVSGLERLPSGGPVVFACNHASYADVPALLALLARDVRFVAKREVLRYPFVSAFVRRCGHLTVDRWDAVQSVADAEVVARELQAGHHLVFFPEGTFHAATGLRPFRLGAFLAATRAGAVVVPLALSGTRRVLRADRLLPRPGPIALWIGEPIGPRGSELGSLVALRDAAHDAIAEHCGEAPLDLVAAGPERVPV